MAKPAVALVSKPAGSLVTKTLPPRVPVTPPGRVPQLRPFLGLVAALSLLVSAPALAQNSGYTLDTRSGTVLKRPVPDENTLARLVWGTMIALDQANRTGNYSVLYELGTTAFQRNNSPDQLRATFTALRTNRVDVGRAVLNSPNYYIPPDIDQRGQLRLRGGFDYRPKSIRFDLLFAQEGGGWRINGISVVEMSADAPR